MDLEEYVELFKALSHPVRLKITCGLSKKQQCCVSVMVEKLQVSQPVVSQHLNILKNAGVVVGYRNGNQICYKLANNKVKKIIEAMEATECK